MKNETLKKYQFSILSTILFLLLLEILGRSFFFQKYSQKPFGAVYLFSILRDQIVKRRAVSDPGSGLLLNQRAWKATYEERGMKVPPGGPREGWWGARIEPKVKSTFIRYHEPPRDIPGLVEIDANGYQHAAASHPTVRILILGGSVAFGAYASSIKETYFNKLVNFLARERIDSEVFVLASGAWISTDEMVAYAVQGVRLKPDVVLCLNGLNDLANEPGNVTDLADEYLRNMKSVRAIAIGNSSTVVFSLQPFLLSKKHRTPLEDRVLLLSLAAVSKQATDLKSEYEQLKTQLQKLASPQTDTYFLDCSTVFDDEPYTTFTDLWHFSDYGHTLVAKRLAVGLMPILKNRNSNRVF